MTSLLWHLLRDSAARFPSRPAVSFRDTVLTYEDLDLHSDHVAWALSSAGIGRGDRVGVFLPKSTDSVVAILGILKSGAAYVPIDPSSPAPRAAYILNDCAVRAVVATPRRLAQLEDLLDRSGIELFIVSEGDESIDLLPATFAERAREWSALADTIPSPPREPQAIESDPAYLLYTSGSTGHPKGVILSHRHALNFVEWGATTFSTTCTDRLSNHAPFHFDLSIFDIFVALHSGACVVLVPDEVAAFPIRMAGWIDSERISVWYSVPSALVRMLNHGDMERFNYSPLRAVLFAGEVFPVKYLRGVMEQMPTAEFYNLYGPTETNVCTYFLVPRPLPTDLTNIPIGGACANTRVVALNGDDREIGVGQEGELCVAGPAVMLGYWNQPDKTAAVLVRSPLQEAFYEPLYRTGDIVHLGGDGCFTFVGRRDHMVKSRGYRIELGEIEQTLYQNEQIKEAAVLAVPDDEIGNRLVAVIVVSPDSGLTVSDVRSFCQLRLPRYMVPETVRFEAALPKTSTGKVDRVALALSVQHAGEEVAVS